VQTACDGGLDGSDDTVEPQCAVGEEVADGSRQGSRKRCGACLESSAHDRGDVLEGGGDVVMVA
jgi:hypothetical protein